MLRLHDTAIGQVRELSLREPGKVSLYVCGPTVYDVPHIGHGRSYLLYDVLVRFLEWTGLQVDHVRNITDIEDKIINRANETGRDPADIVAEFEKSFYDAMDLLGVKRPTHDPHATDYVDHMLDLIGRLAERDLAYETSDGVYLDTGAVEGYGLLAQQSLDDLQAGERVEVNEEKRSPLDFVLWKKAKPGEPSWASPWGDGRPGWHTECVVMSLDLLGDGFDLHAGGLDLKFPHHENERAQAVGLGYTFARHWMHHAFVDVGGVKMSKSLHNFTSVVDLLERHDARAYRLLVLRSHYRSPMEVTPDTIGDAEKGLDRIDEFARRFPRDGAAPDADAVDRFRAAMEDDLNTPAAVALLFDLVRKANSDQDSAAVAAAYVVLDALGLDVRQGDDEVDEATAALVAARDEARRTRDFAAADRIRDELQALGWVVKDTAE
ncbi:MAG: cysteinyl-tRNA synthetase, partial [Acidimicrobiaceae bacterium]|nr:cysteinyl-tRNA synthetase [Acidimicrobiaceae bacterium]